MCKFVLFLSAVFIFCSMLQAMPVHAEEGSAWLNKANVKDGIVSVAYDVKTGVKTKLQIAKGEEKYTYTLKPGKVDAFPLQSGNGEYTVSVLEHVSDNKYRVMKKDTIKLELADNAKVYLNSIQNVSWKEANQAVRKAKELTEDLTADTDKVKAIYNYIINHIKYDDSLAVSGEYVPQIDPILTSNKAICYGYASLFAAMLRSVDIPTQLVMGKSEYVDTYHAWNKVYLDHQWVTIDTTVDAGWNGSSTAFDMIKDASKYTATKHY
ncbi:hypothetical protein PAE9249_02734 [Paenibacillus sp. CECT 9249]|nr:transglutaminase-like domain-containing protein [Paenibacillus sp. MSJ-34]CAH0120218.1 hypothetical protein PAE9249_02734 [Paenibacillus sp. CECT 9249]